MLQAMNTGHDGSMTTLHANTPRDALSRLETMIAMASLDLPEKAMRQQIASAINVVIQVSRLGDGTRKVTRSPRSSAWKATSSPCRTSSSSSGRASATVTRCSATSSATGIRPKFADRLKSYGIDLARHALLQPRATRPHARAAEALSDGRLCRRRRWICRAARSSWRWPSARSRWRCSWSSSRSGAASGTRCVSFAPSPDDDRGRRAWSASRRRSRCPTGCEPIAARVPALAGPRLMLEQAGLKMSLADFLVISVGLSLALGLGLLVLTRYWPRPHRRAVFGARCRTWCSDASGTSGSTSSRSCSPRPSTCSGAPSAPATRCRPGSRWWPTRPGEPIASEFRRTHEEHRFGLPFEDAMLAMADRVNIVDVRILVTAILIQREVGGNLAEVLDNLATGDPGALHHPAPAPGLHRPGPVQRLRAGACCRSRSARPSTG